MISRATIDAAARVAEYAACRPIALNLTLMPMPPADDAGAAATENSQAAATAPITIDDDANDRPGLHRARRL